jgi:hypothetical protein
MISPTADDFSATIKHSTAPTECSLSDLTQQLKDIASTVTSMNLASLQAGTLAVSSAVKGGAILIKCKSLVARGGWEKWLLDHVPEISHETACRWMRLANLSSVTDLSAVSSLTEAYRLCEKPRGSEKQPSPATAPSGRSQSQATLRASSTLQKQMRLLVQKKTTLADDERNQLKLLWGELSTLFRQIIGEGQP